MFHSIDRQDVDLLHRAGLAVLRPTGDKTMARAERLTAAGLLRKNANGSFFLTETGAQAMLDSGL